MTHTDVPRAVPRWRRRFAVAIGGLLTLATCVTIRYFWGASPANAKPQEAQEAAPQPAQQPAQAPAPEAPASGPQAKVVALVNGETLSREDLATECLRHYGQQVLESVCNKYLIILECQRQNVSVTQEEVNAEIERMAKRFKLPVDNWLKMLKQERGINARQYANDIIWPTLALRKLAGERLAITPEEVRAEFDTVYGPAVKGRIISWMQVLTEEDEEHGGEVKRFIPRPCLQCDDPHSTGVHAGNGGPMLIPVMPPGTNCKIVIGVTRWHGIHAKR